MPDLFHPIIQLIELWLFDIGLQAVQKGDTNTMQSSSMTQMPQLAS